MLLCLWTSMLLITGCFGRNSSGTPSEPDLLATLPDDWIPVEEGGPWRQIDIDSDSGEIEYLLFFTYSNQVADSASGPVGAVIYDLQNNSDYVPNAQAIPMPYQPSGSYIPYRVLPNYWKGSGTGFIAPTGSVDQITSTEAVRSGVDQQREVETVETDDDTDVTIIETVQVKELLVEDGGNTVTVLWWRDVADGYGAASVYADGGITDMAYEVQGQNTTPLVSFVGQHPFDDRSELCAATLYTREYITASNAITTTDQTLDIDFQGTPYGIDFCAEPPNLPFYPEDVVLRYLLGGDPGDPAAILSDDADKDAAVQLVEAIEDGEGRISGLFAPPVIPFNGPGESRATVCVEIVDKESGESVAYSFRLRHLKPKVSDSSTDEFIIYDMDIIPAPEGGPPVDCAEIVPDGTPGREAPP